VGNVFFSGNFKTRTDLLGETMGLEEGTPSPWRPFSRAREN
jgi:hypothetical protein